MSKPDPIDVHVGSRVRMRRKLLGISQQQLGKGLGLTFQQIQKYERGANRIGSSRLFKLSNILGIPVSYFFEDISKEGAGDARNSGVKKIGSFNQDQFSSKETLELVRNYYKIRDIKLRKRIFEMIKGIGRAELV